MRIKQQETCLTLQGHDDDDDDDDANSGNTNKWTILQSIYSFYHWAPTYFGIVAIFSELTRKLLKRTAIYNTIHTHTNILSLYY